MEPVRKFEAPNGRKSSMLIMKNDEVVNNDVYEFYE